MLHIDDELLHMARVRREYFELPAHEIEQSNTKKSKSTKSKRKAGRQKQKAPKPHLTKWSRMNIENPVEPAPGNRKKQEDIYEPLAELMHRIDWPF